jgi:hypothetical protein
MMIAEFPFQVHPNRRDQTQSLGRRVNALTDEQRSSLLHWLSGYNPAAVEQGINRLMELAQ